MLSICSHVYSLSEYLLGWGVHSNLFGRFKKFNCVVHYFIFELQVFFIYFWYKSFIRYIFQKLLPVFGLSFHSLSVFYKTEGLKKKKKQKVLILRMSDFSIHSWLCFWCWNWKLLTTHSLSIIFPTFFLRVLQFYT